MFDGIILSQDELFFDSSIFNQVLRYKMKSGEVLNPHEFYEKYWLKVPLKLIKKNQFCFSSD